MHKIVCFDTEKEAIQILKKLGVFVPKYRVDYYTASICINKNTGEEIVGCETPLLQYGCSSCDYKEIKPNKYFIKGFPIEIIKKTKENV